MISAAVLSILFRLLEAKIIVIFCYTKTGSRNVVYLELARIICEIAKVGK